MALSWVRSLVANQVQESLYLELKRGDALSPTSPPVLSSAAIWSSITNETEIGREEALSRRADHQLSA